MNIVSLNKVPVGKTAIIMQVDISNKLQSARLSDVGITKGSCITPCFVSSSRDSIAYYVKNSLIALRNEDAENINVLYE